MSSEGLDPVQAWRRYNRARYALLAHEAESDLAMHAHPDELSADPQVRTGHRVGMGAIMADKGMYDGQRSARFHMAAHTDDGVPRSVCEDRPLILTPGVFNPMSDNACRECCTAIRLSGDPRLRPVGATSS